MNFNATMKVLFICSQKVETKISPFVKAQATAIEDLGWEVSFFLIEKKGFLGYLLGVYQLRKFRRKNHFDIYHAHYSFCGYVASLAGCRPLVVSLLGSDVLKNAFWRSVTRFFYKIFNWNSLIVKSEEMKQLLKLKKVEVVPNGVNLSTFYPVPRLESRTKLGWEMEEKIILFNGHKNNFVKNYSLASSVVSQLPFEAKMMEIKGLTQENLNLMYNACDVFLSTSLWEGSPNTIKEAMACNTNIVATEVGDISFLFGKNSKNQSCSFNFDDIRNSLIKILDESPINDGRERIIQLKLDSISVAKKITTLYEHSLGPKP